MAPINMFPGAQLMDPRVSYAQTLQEQALSGAPIQHWAQGVGRLGKALLARNAQQGIQQDQQAAMQAMFGQQQEGQPVRSILERLQEMPQNPYAASLAMQEGTRQRGREEAFTDFERQRGIIDASALKRQQAQQEFLRDQAIRKESLDQMKQQDLFGQQMELAELKRGPLDPERAQQDIEKAMAGKPDYSVITGPPAQVPGTTNAQGIPLSTTTPWEGLPGKDAVKMKSDVWRDERKHVRALRGDVQKQQGMVQSLKRFMYLNSIQETGGPMDRLTDVSFDDEKREMVTLTNRLTPAMRQGMPGAASDRDVAMFRGATVGIGNTEEINKAIATGMITMLENAEDRVDFMEDYLRTNKHLEGAEQAWNSYIQANPIFDPSAGEGSYVLNENRQKYREFFKEGPSQEAPQAGQPQQPGRIGRFQVEIE